MPTRAQNLLTENLGVNAVEALALREGLSVARPIWDHEGIDLLVYRVTAGLVTAVGVQVKSYSGTTWRIDTKYDDHLVMVFVWNVYDEPTMFALRAKQAKKITREYTLAHNTRGGQAYDPAQHDRYTKPRAPKALYPLLEPWEVGDGCPNTLGKVCNL